MSEVRLIFLVGPTASGKTDLSLQLAQQFSAEIINADSIQVYKSLNIGSAKPTAEELSLVPHHMIGHIPDGQTYTAGQFRKAVLEIIENRSKIGINNFIIVGGSGFYLKALIYGLYEIPSVSEEIKERIKNEDPKKLHQQLAKTDPESFKRIHPNDTYRISRAAEVYEAFQIPFSQYLEKFSENKIPYKYIKIGLKADKEKLKKRVELRVVKMLQAGLIAETQQLLSQGHHHWAALQSVGYREVQLHLKGELAEESLLEEIVKNSMGLIKRQMTWFKKDSEIHWFDIFETNFEKQILVKVKNFLQA